MPIFSKLFKRKAPPKEPQPPARKPEAKREPAPAEKPPQKKGKTAPAQDPMTPEERCEISAKMSKDEIRAQLAKMFRRHNRLASSMDPAARQEAEYMLDVIVQMREKYLG